MLCTLLPSLCRRNADFVVRAYISEDPTKYIVLGKFYRRRTFYPAVAVLSGISGCTHEWTGHFGGWCPFAEEIGSGSCLSGVDVRRQRTLRRRRTLLNLHMPAVPNTGGRSVHAGSLDPRGL